MAKQKVTVEVEVPEGWELTGEYRTPVVGEIYLYYGGERQRLNTDFWQFPVFLLRKVRTPQVGEVWASRPHGIVHILILPGNLALTISGPFGGEADPFPIVTDYWHYAFPSTKEWAESLKEGEGK